MSSFNFAKIFKDAMNWAFRRSFASAARNPAAGSPPVTTAVKRRPHDHAPHK